MSGWRGWSRPSAGAPGPRGFRGPGWSGLWHVASSEAALAAEVRPSGAEARHLSCLNAGLKPCSTPFFSPAFRLFTRWLLVESTVNPCRSTSNSIQVSADCCLLLADCCLRIANWFALFAFIPEMNHIHFVDPPRLNGFSYENKGENYQPPNGDRTVEAPFLYAFSTRSWSNSWSIANHPR